MTLASDVKKWFREMCGISDSNCNTYLRDCLLGCLLEKPKSPVPKLKDLSWPPSNAVVKSTDFVQENIRIVKTLKCEERPNISQDSCDGHRQDLEKAGLKLKYIFKKEYGKTPGYIIRYRRQQEAQEKCHNSESSRIRYIEEEEKQMVLNGLKNNFKEAQTQLLLLPVITDTLSKQRRKIELENRLSKLEKDIEMLEKNEIIVIKD